MRAGSQGRSAPGIAAAGIGLGSCGGKSVCISVGIRIGWLGTAGMKKASIVPARDAGSETG
jgi:hypothetical protein